MSETQEKVTITVRLILSFEHRNIKHVVYKDVSSLQTVEEFTNYVLKDLKTRPGLLPPFRNHKFDTFKISHQPFGAKTADPVINTTCDEELILPCDKKLQQCHIVNETELSFFNLEEYRSYQRNPKLLW